MQGSFSRKAGTYGLLFGGFLLLVPGCGDGGTGPDDGLTKDEAQALFERVSAIRQDSTRVLHSSNDSTVVACPLAGQIRVTESVAEALVGDTLRLVEDLAAAPAGCRFSQGGREFTVDGDPGILEHTVVSLVGLFQSFIVDGTVTGSVDWRIEGRSGSCGVDLVRSGGADLGRGRLPEAEKLSGTLCGHNVDFEVESVSGPSG